jgi:hypothetical protein
LDKTFSFPSKTSVPSYLLRDLPSL